MASLAVLVALLLGLLAWGGWSHALDAEPALGGLAGEESVARVGALDDAERQAHSTGDPERRGLERSAVAQAEDPAAMRLHGVCVDEAGLPLAGVTVRATLEGVAEGSGPIETRTGDDGLFALDVGVDGERDVQVGFEATGRVPVRTSIRRPLPQEVYDLGRVVLREAIAVEGVVVDEDGAPVPEVLFRFVYVDMTPGPQPGPFDVQPTADHTLEATTDAAGRFALPAPAFPGEWWISPAYTGPLVEPRSVQLRPGSGTHELRVVVERPDPEQAIRGRVVDELGMPIAGVHLQFVGRGFVGRGRSGADGRFLAARAGPIPGRGEAAMRVSADHAAGEFELLPDAAHAAIDWGDREVELRMRKRVSCPVRVVDERGASVEDYALTVLAESGTGRFRRTGRGGLHGRHPDGRCVVHGLADGHIALLVHPNDPALATSALARFEVVEGRAPVDPLVVVPDRVPWRVAVRFASGALVSGSRVELLLRLAPDPESFDGKAYRVEDVDRMPRLPVLVTVAAASTDETGVATLQAPPGDWLLRVRGPEHVDHSEPVRVVRSTVPHGVVVRGGATVRGIAGPTNALERLRELCGDDGLRVTCTPVGADLEARAVAIDPDGSFSITSLEPGEYAVDVHLDYVASAVHSSDDTWRVTQREFTEGGETTLEIDLAPWLPARVEGRVTVDGRPLAGVHCFLVGSAGGGARLLRVGLDDDGRFTTWARPGTWSFALTLPAQPGPGWYRVPVPDQSWTVEPGGQHRIEVPTVLRRARIGLVDSEGAPLTGRELRIRHEGYYPAGVLRTDAAGWCELEPAPLGAFEVLVEVEEAWRAFGPFDLPAGAAQGELLVTVE